MTIFIYILVALGLYAIVGFLSPFVIAGGLFAGWLWQDHRRWAAFFCFVTPGAAYAFYVLEAHRQLVEEKSSITPPSLGLFVAYVFGTVAWTAIGRGIFKAR